MRRCSRRSKVCWRKPPRCFPDPVMHIGGDEVNPTWWRASEAVQAFMLAEGLIDERAMQNSLQPARRWHTRTPGQARDGLGRSAAPDSCRAPPFVQSWRGATATGNAVAGGFDCVVSAPYYLDLFYPAAGTCRCGPPRQLRYANRWPVRTHCSKIRGLSTSRQGMRWTHQWRAVEAAKGEAPEAGSSALRRACGRSWSAPPCCRFGYGAACRRSLSGSGRRAPWPASISRGWKPRWLACLRWVSSICAAISGDCCAPREWLEQWWPLIEQLEPVKWYARLLGEQALQARLSGVEMPQARPYDADTPLDRAVDVLFP